MPRNLISLHFLFFTYGSEGVLAFLGCFTACCVLYVVELFGTNFNLTLDMID